MTYPIESLLRCPVEWYSSIACLIVAGVLFLFTSYFWIDSRANDVIAIGLMLLALHRFLQGFHVLRYQKNLKGQGEYSLSSDELPISHKTLFLG